MWSGEDQMHLRDEVTAQRCVPGSHPERVERNNVSHPLDLMDDCISVGHVGSVCHGWLAGLSDHSVYLFLNFVYKANHIRLLTNIEWSSFGILICFFSENGSDLSPPWMWGFFIRYRSPHCRVFEVVSLPAKNRSRQHRTRFSSTKPTSCFLLCCWAKWWDKHAVRS